MQPFSVYPQSDETADEREKLMTSSSSKYTHRECCRWKDCEDRRGKTQPKKKKEDWLELTLGLGSNDDPSSKMIMVPDDDEHGATSSINSASQSSSSSSPPQQQQGQEIIAPGFVRNTEEKQPQHHHHHDYNYLPFGSFPSSSSSPPLMLCKSMPVLLQSHGLPRPVLDVPNHYYIARPHPGIWFALRSTVNRNGEGLPQIPKPYIRLKDCNVTVWMVKTYLARTLGLANEAEVEISCMGQTLPHSHTIKYVRDAIWVPKLVEFVYSTKSMLDISQIVHHLMSLDYGKS